jgi:hypothetical protein
MSMRRSHRILLSGLAAGCLAWQLAVSPAPAIAATNTKGPMDELLDHAAQVVESFLGQISNVECTEVVSQAKFEKNNKVEYQENSTFDYVVLAQSNAGEPVLAESRLPKQEPNHKQNLPLMVTNGFAMFLLVFHPYYRSGFEFTDQGDEAVGNRPYAKVGFRHVKGLRTTTALLVRGRVYPLELHGTAWIDKETGTVLRISAGLEDSMDDIGLRAMQADVLYAPVTFQGTPQAYWLPSQAVIDVQSLRNRWRNIHSFTAYHRFSTEVKSKIGQ